MWLWKWVIGNLNPYTGSAKSYFQSVTLTAEAKNCEKNKPWIFTFLSITSSPQKSTLNAEILWQDETANQQGDIFILEQSVATKLPVLMSKQSVSAASLKRQRGRREQSVCHDLWVRGQGCESRKNPATVIQCINRLLLLLQCLSQGQMPVLKVNEMCWSSTFQELSCMLTETMWEINPQDFSTLSKILPQKM